MRLITTVVRGSVTSLAIGCTLFALACGGKAGVPSPIGSGGAGGLLTSGGADAALSGGAGGWSQATVVGGDGATVDTRIGSGGDVGSGGHASGGSAGNTQLQTGGAAGGSGGVGGTVVTGGVASGGTTAASSGAGGKSTATGGATGGSSGGSSGTLAAQPSAGCGKTPPASGRATINISGTSREYILKVPDGYDANHPYRLIFGFHGAKYDDNWVADGGAPLTGPYFGVESEAKGSAIFVAPQAQSGGFSSQDLPFVDAMVAQFEAQLCVDKSRIFSIGFSMGAIMTLTIGCNRGDVFRAIAPMSGSLPSPCPTGNHVAYWASHGNNDTTISPAQGQAARDEFVKRNHCGTQTSSPDTNNCVTYQGCDQGYPVVWCAFSGVHEPAPFAGPEIWQFLAPI